MRYSIFCTVTLFALIAVSVSSCGGPKSFQEISLPDLGVSIKVSADWMMTVKRSDKSAFEHRLQHQPEYIFAPITAAKDDPILDDISKIPNWRFIGLKGKFDPEMSAMSADYPKPDGLYFVNPQKGELLEQDLRNLPWPGAEGIEATVRLYEETHGTGGFSDLWHAYTVTFNHNGNAMEFIMRIPSEPDKRKWIEMLWESIAELNLNM